MNKFVTIYQPLPCRIEKITPLTPTEKLFLLSKPDNSPLGHNPGEFVEVSILGVGEVPISVASSPTRDIGFELAIRRAGVVTSALHKLKVGDEIGIRGPFGRGFEIEKLKNKNLILIAGGCGLAPLRSLIQYVIDKREGFKSVSICYGARNPESIMFDNELDLWEKTSGISCTHTVDTASSESCYDGNVGLITSIVEKMPDADSDSVAVIVGPPIMYRYVIEILKKKGFASQNIVLSLERQMRCGIGKCGHCVIDHLYCCKDGPVFYLSEIEDISGAI